MTIPDSLIPTFESDPCVVNQHIQPAIFLLEEVAESSNALQIINIQLMEESMQPLLPEFCHCFLATADVSGCHVHVPGELLA